MTLGMLLPPIARSIVERRWRLPAERPVIPDIGPDAACIGLALRQDRHARVVGMETISGKHMRLDLRCTGFRATAQAPTWSASVDRLRSTPSRA